MDKGTSRCTASRSGESSGVWTRTSLIPTPHGNTGANEHHNTRIRRYLPTRTDFRTISVGYVRTSWNRMSFSTPVSILGHLTHHPTPHTTSVGTTIRNHSYEG